MSAETSGQLSTDMLLACSARMPPQAKTIAELEGRLAIGRPFGEFCNQYFAQTSTNAYVNVVGELNWDAALDNATPAYQEDDGMAPILAFNPVAAHQEYDHIGQTLAQYIPEATGEYGRRIMLFVNWPADTDNRRVDQTLQIVTDFQKSHPEVPLSYCTRELAPKTPMGTIVKMAADSLLIGSRNSQRLDDIMLVPHAADIVSLSPNHFDTLYRRFSAPQALPRIAVKPRVLRERSGGKLPNLDAVIAWSDLYTQWSDSALELGVGMSARGYMAANGPDPGRTLAEVHNLLYRMSPVERQVMRMPQLVKQATLVTSARREWHHLVNGGSPESYWQEGMEMTESYREVDALVDISAEQRDRAAVKVAAGLRYSLLHIVVEHLVRKGCDLEHARKKAVHRILLANAWLGTSIHEEPWCEFINQSAARIELLKP